MLNSKGAGLSHSVMSLNCLKKSWLRIYTKNFDFQFDNTPLNIRVSVKSCANALYANVRVFIAFNTEVL